MVVLVQPDSATLLLQHTQSILAVLQSSQLTCGAGCAPSTLLLDPEQLLGQTGHTCGHHERATIQESATHASIAAIFVFITKVTPHHDKNISWRPAGNVRCVIDNNNARLLARLLAVIIIGHSTAVTELLPTFACNMVAACLQLNHLPVQWQCPALSFVQSTALLASALDCSLLE